MCASQNGFGLSQLQLIRKLCWQRTLWIILHQNIGRQKLELVSVGYHQVLNRLTAE